jgi:hypothetical protein
MDAFSRIKEDAVSSIQGVSSATAPSPTQFQKLAQPPAVKDRDHDGDVDKPGVVDNDKGSHINLTA